MLAFAFVVVAFLAGAFLVVVVVAGVELSFFGAFAFAAVLVGVAFLVAFGLASLVSLGSSDFFSFFGAAAFFSAAGLVSFFASLTGPDGPILC